jgi:hypothetical protein
MDAIIAYLLENFPIIALFILLLIGVSFLVYKITTLINRSNNFYEKVDSLPCEDRRAVNEANYNILKDNLSNMSKELTAIRVFLQVKHETVDLFSAKKSPRALNNYGEEIFSKINGNEFLKNNKDFLFGLINKYSPKTALDVEYYSNYILLRLTDDDIFNQFKDFVYVSKSVNMVLNNNNIEHSLSVLDICFILSIPLRDMYLEEHQEIVPEELEEMVK